MADEASATPGSSGKKFTRGVSYPVMTLEQAIEKARVFHREERKSAAPVASAMKHFGYSESSSGGRQTIATLIQFGLLEDEGKKENRHVKLTNRALTVLLAEPDSPERWAAIKECACMPRIYDHLLTKWPADLPSDTTLAYYLQKEFDFNPKTLHSFLEDFRSTVAFAKIFEPSAIHLTGAGKGQPVSGPNDEADKRSEQAEVEIGDVIQWEANGVLRLDSPRRVRAKQEHEGSWWVFVEGSETGIPMEEAVIVERKGGDEGGGQKQMKVPPVLPIATQDLIPDSARGEREWLRGPLSKDVSYRLIVTGALGSKELGKLIKLLEAQKLVLDED